jgi:hypothetical protein
VRLRARILPHDHFVRLSLSKGISSGPTHLGVRIGPFGLGRGHQKRACLDGWGATQRADAYFFFALTGGPFSINIDIIHS